MEQSDALKIVLWTLEYYEDFYNICILWKSPLRDNEKTAGDRLLAPLETTGSGRKWVEQERLKKLC